MNWFRSIAAKLGYIPRATAEASVSRALQAFHRHRRAFEAGSSGRLTADFMGTRVSTDSDLVQKLKLMRARSRALAKDEPYARRYVRLVEKNIAGPTGVQLNVLGGDEPSDAPLLLTRAQADYIEARWRAWSCSDWVCTDRRTRWPQAQRRALRGGCTDGEAFVRLVTDPTNPWLVSLRFMAPDQFDELHNLSLSGGGEIRLAVEFDAGGRRVAYHPFLRNPIDNLPGSNRAGVGIRTRLAAEEVVHWYIDEFGQSRGVPWLYSGISRINMLGGYEEAELVAARVAASKMGFIVPPAGQEYSGDDLDAEGNTVIDAEPGSFETLPAGSELKSFDPQHPNANFAPFTKTMLRGIAAAGDVSYHTLSGDLEAVNYSSARIGLLDERDSYAMLQDEFIGGFCWPIFRAWLVSQAAIDPNFPLSIDEARTFDQVIWRARRWAWVDPQKEIEAGKSAVALNIRSRTQIVAEAGGDFVQTAKELSKEKGILEELGLNANVDAKPPREASGKEDKDEASEGEEKGAAAGRNGHLKPECFLEG